ncbi:MAG: T9SS type A sorting domain-containing protein [Saprospiraceae bacterium]|nr:T9SS type A sorting domain-containing protein [Saprospiraceae bacterium]
MMILKISTTLLFLICFLTPAIEAQSNTLSAGGNASSASGSVSFSIGQPDYISASGITGNLNQGLQQPFEFFIITGTQEDKINLRFNTFPNPTKQILNLEINMEDVTNLKYQIYNLNAQLIINELIKSKNTIIDLNLLLNGTYILKINRGQLELKSFKIIKN